VTKGMVSELMTRFESKTATAVVPDHSDGTAKLKD
jgi:hypothetical protein